MPAAEVNETCGLQENEMAAGHALLVGLTSVDPAMWGGWDGRSGCWGCELDVDNLAEILSQQGLHVSTLKTRSATRQRILQALESAAEQRMPGDLFVFYYSGHGGTRYDFDQDEYDQQDETLCAYDGHLVDDELARIWPRFRKGVRIVMLSDSCHSGTNYRMARAMSQKTPLAMGLGKAAKGQRAAPEMKASLLHFGGCRDDQTSAGYRHGGAFTMALCRVWKDGRFQGNYVDLHQKIRRKLERESQVCQFSEWGKGTGKFKKQRPFQIGSEPVETPEAPSRIEELIRQIQQLLASLRREPPLET